MAKISNNAVEIVKDLNEKLFEAEFELDQQQRAVNKYRYYLAADPTADSVMDLCGAIRNLRGIQKKVDDLRRSLDKAVDNIWSL